MTEDNVRQMWSDAELDAALHDLHREAGSEDALAGARAALLAAAGGAPVARRLESPPAKKRGGSWRWIAVAAAVAALTGGLVVAKEAGLPEVSDIGGPVGGPDQLLVLTGSDLPLPANGYRHSVRSQWVLVYSTDGKSSAYLEERVERWIPADPRKPWQLTRTRTGTVRWRSGEPSEPGLIKPLPGSDTHFAPGGRFAPELASSQPYPNTTTSKQNPPPKFGTGNKVKLSSWDAPDADFITALPTDPATLRTMLELDGPGQNATAGEALKRVRNVLEVGLATAEQRVALYKALAMSGYVAVRQNTQGPGGTQGIGFEVSGADRLTLVVDPSTAQLLSSTETTGKSPSPTRESTYTFSVSLKQGQ